MILMLLSGLKEGASSLCLIASLVSTQGIQTTILSDLLHSSSQAQIQLGPSLGIDLLYSPFPSTKSNYPLTPHLQKSHTTVTPHLTERSPWWCFSLSSILHQDSIMHYILQCRVMRCSTVSCSAAATWRGGSRCWLQWSRDARPLQSSLLTSPIVHLDFTFGYYLSRVEFPTETSSFLHFK